MEELKFKFEFNYIDVVRLVKGCQELPYKETANLIKYINDEYVKQQQELEIAAKKEKAKSSK